VIYSLRLSSSTELSPVLFRRILNRLSDEGWHPAALIAEQEFATRVGISKESVIDHPIRKRTLLH
jgi:hypothetical protein